MGYSKESIDAMMKSYSRFGLNEGQLNQLRQILTKMTPDNAVTNKLITDSALDDLFTGRSYIPEGTLDPATKQPIKNTPGISQSRDNLLDFIKKNSQSSTAPATTPPIQTNSKPSTQSTAARSQAMQRVRNKVTQPTNKTGSRFSGGRLTKPGPSQTPPPTRNATLKIRPESGRVTPKVTSSAPQAPPTSRVVTPLQGPRMATRFGPAEFTNTATTASKPGAQALLRTGLKRSGIPLVAGVVDAGVDIVENKENPLVAAGRAIAGTAVGSFYGTTTGMLAGEPTLEGGALSVMTSYNLGRQQGIRAFDNALGIDRTARTPAEQYQSSIDATKGNTYDNLFGSALENIKKKKHLRSEPGNPELPPRGPAANEFVGKEDEAMAIWAEKNEGLAKAKEKRDSTRGTSKSENPLMKQYIEDRGSRGEVLREISQQAKADTIADSPYAARINKQEAARQASVDSAIEKYSRPKADPKEVEAFANISGYTSEEAKNMLEGGATEVVFDQGKEPVATLVDPQAFLSNSIGKLTTPTSTFVAANEGQPTVLNLDGIGSYMTPDNEDMYKNLFPRAKGLNLRTGAR